jgi:methyl-accepting chemotaxis protein
MKNMKLSVKLIGGFLVVALVTLIVGVFGYRGVTQTGSALYEVGNVRLPSILGLEIMNEAQTAVRKGESSLLIPEFFTDEQEATRQMELLAEAWKRAEEGWKIYEPLPQTKEEAVIWNNFKPAWDQWKRDHNQVIELIKKGDREAALALYKGQGRDSFKASEKLLGDLISLNKNVAEIFQTEAERKSGLAAAISLIGMIVGTLMALALGIFLTLSITRPLHRVIAGLSDGSAQVASASGQVSSASQQLAEGASEQAASLEETSSSLEEMAAMTRQNADNANQVNSLMKEVSQVVGAANQSMGQLTVSMEEISRASEETSKIIKTIDEIAFQTNLLALNAAVEAARAGEAGAGFAVVADEVRNLAMRAAEAAKNTANLIEGTVKKVKEGSLLVTKTNEAFSEVASATGRVAELSAEVAAASNEQSQGIEQVNKAVAEMDKVIQQNAANAEESASASEELNAQAEQMKSFVGDLVALVGGGRNGRGDGSPAMVMGSRPKTSFHKAIVHAAPIRRGKGRELGLRHAEEVKPDQVIPLHDEGFKDF